MKKEEEEEHILICKKIELMDIPAVENHKCMVCNEIVGVTAETKKHFEIFGCKNKNYICDDCFKKKKKDNLKGIDVNVDLSDGQIQEVLNALVKKIYNDGVPKKLAYVIVKSAIKGFYDSKVKEIKDFSRQQYKSIKEVIDQEYGGDEDLFFSNDDKKDNLEFD